MKTAEPSFIKLRNHVFIIFQASWHYKLDIFYQKSYKKYDLRVVKVGLAGYAPGCSAMFKVSIGS